MNEKVRQQYNNFIYPRIFDDLELAIKEGNYEIGDPKYYWHLMWSYEKTFDKLDVLIAGCGTNQAAHYAFNHPNWNVIGIDISESSLKHEEMLKQKHNLTNLTLEKMELTDLYKLNKNFDFIVCTGVLHHLENPKVGLDALKSVLKKDGVINLMMHGKTLRMGVYLIKEIFKILDIKQDQKGIDFVRMVINSLPEYHILKRYLNITNNMDLDNDAHTIDTFLHPIDQGYFVKDIFSFIRESGLEFLNWCDPVEYSPYYSIGEYHPMFNSLKSLKEEEIYHISDIVAMDRGTHRFFIANSQYVNKQKIDISSENIAKFSVVPHMKLTKILNNENSLNQNIKFQINDLVYSIDQTTMKFLNELDISSNIEEAAIEFNKDNLYGKNFIDFIIKEIKWMCERNILFLVKPNKDFKKISYSIE